MYYMHTPVKMCLFSVRQGYLPIYMGLKCINCTRKHSVTILSLYSGEENVNDEMKKIFPSMQTNPSTSSAHLISDKSHESVLARADRLLTELRSNPTSKNTRKRRRHVGKCREYQRNFIVIDYPGHNPPAVQVLHDYDKVYEGTLLFNVTMSEGEIRRQISHLVQQKKSTFMDFSEIEPEDFMFVKCVNRRVQVPDGKAVYDVRELYRSANIYVRLTKSFDKSRVYQ